MIKKIFLFFCCLEPALLAAQTVDSVTVRHVDSMTLVFRSLIIKQRNYDKALQAIDSTEKIVLEKLGRLSASYAYCCFYHGMAYFHKKIYPEAEKWLLEAKNIQEQLNDRESLSYAHTLSYLAITYRGMTLYTKTEPLLYEAKAIVEKKVGKQHQEYATCLNYLAVLYHAMGNYEKAEPLWLEAKDIREKNLGKLDLDYASMVNNLAVLYKDMGNYEKAELFLLEVKDIRAKTAGKNRPEYLSILNNMAALYCTMGDFEKAEGLFPEINAINEKIGKKEEGIYWNAQSIQANAYAEMGSFEKAEPIFLNMKEAKESLFGKWHPEYAFALNGLSNLYIDMGNYEKAESILFEIKAILEKVSGKEHPDYAECLNKMASLYIETGQYPKAEALLIEASAILENKVGKEHPNYAKCQSDLANVYLLMGAYEKSEPLWLEAIAIQGKVLGENHASYANSLFGLITLYEKQKRFSASEPLLTAYASLQQARLSKAVTFLSERELAKYTIRFRQYAHYLDAFLYDRQRAGQQLGTLPTLAFDQSLFYKGFLLDASGRLRKIADDSPETNEINNRLKGYRRRLAAEYAKSVAERKEVSELEEKATAVEKELAHLVTDYAQSAKQVKWRDVQLTLKTGEAAIEFVHFQVDFPNKTDSVLYAALLLLPGADQARFVPLFEARQLNALLKSAGNGKADWMNLLYTGSGIGQKSLYELLWRPIEPALAGVQIIYFSPIGQLHRLNLGAITIPSELRGPSDATTLGERFLLIELGSTRQLATNNGNTATNYENNALLFGGIQYEMDSTAMASATADHKNNSLTSPNRGLDFASTDSTLRGGRWQYLPWTNVEVTALDGILRGAGIQTTLYKDYAATEEIFKNMGLNQPSPRILHLATHGFFFPDPKMTQDVGRSKLDGSEPVFKYSEHPMIRSGLLLAGGNYAWEKGKPFKPEAEDGILTAYEISQMALSHTELVVLSACETGLGDIQGNEGVYGLQRAFKIAGAKYLIMSLWQVPDFQTQQLMSAFYRNWLQNKMSIPDAFRTAQQAMQMKFKDPFFWAGFVLME